MEKAYAWGRSQTGRCLRDFVYRGFNADAGGRRVFDGVLPHVAGAGRKWLNHRFASPIVSGGQQYEDHFNIADSFPFSYAWSTDHLTGKQDAILKRPETDPLVFHTQTATEYWVRRGSLAHTDTQGNDLPQPDTVRVYCWASSQHFADPLPKPPSRGMGRIFPMSFHLDVVPRQPRCDGPVGDGRHAAAAEPHPDARRRHAGEYRGVAAAVPRHSRRRHAALAQRADAAGFRSRCGARHPARAAAARARRQCARRAGQAIHGAGPVGGSRRQRRAWRARTDGGGTLGTYTGGTCARAATATERNCASRAATSRSPSNRRNGRSPAIRGARSWSDIPTGRPMSRRSSRPRANSWRKG